MIQLPDEADANMRAVASRYRQELTGSTATVITLTYEPARTVDGIALVDVFKNGLLLALTSHGAGTAYTISGKTITLDTALIAGDVLVMIYHYRNI